VGVKKHIGFARINQKQKKTHFVSQLTWIFNSNLILFLIRKHDEKNHIKLILLLLSIYN